jgi:N-acetylglutamate synthase
MPELDQLIANAWPPAVESRHGTWRYRWSFGVTRRANSALAIGADDKVPELVAEGEEFYRRHGALARFLVSTASAPSSLPPYLLEHHYDADSLTFVAHATTAEVIQNTSDNGWGALAAGRPTDAWFDCYWAVESTRGRGADDAAVCRQFLLSPPLPCVYVALTEHDQVMAVGQIVVEGGSAGLQCMATVPAHRQRGAATAVLHRLALEASAIGAQRMYLAVMAVNTTARRLYERSGFDVAHEYSYFSKPIASSA